MDEISSMTGPQKNGARDVSRDVASSRTRLAYKPQFSASSSRILERWRNIGNAARAGSSGINSLPVSPKRQQHNNATTQMAMSMTATLALPLPISQANASHVAKFLAPSRLLTLKRKRSTDDIEADFTQSTIPFRVPAQATVPDSMVASSRLRKTPESDSVRQCSKCGQSSLPSETNEFIACIACQSWSHLQCASATGEGADNPTYLCADCDTGRPPDDQTSADRVEGHERRQWVDRIRRQRLAKLPAGIAPAKPELVGFLAKQASGTERTEYFGGKKRKDLLNILSLCDQLKPQLLVDILVSVSNKHPDLAIFDDPEWRDKLPSRAGMADGNSSGQAARMSDQSRHGPGLLQGKESRKPKGRPKLPKPAMLAKTDVIHALPAVEAAGEGVESSLPPTWPQAGKGLYAKLAPEDEDREFLLDDNDEEAFSHFMVDRMGKQMIVSACA